MANENQELKFQVGEAWKGVYSSSTAYGLANVVQDSTGLSIYRSLKSGNVGHPLSNASWWFRIIDLSSIKAESDRIAALNQAIAEDEALRKAAEELRQQHEAERVAAETQRNENEQARISAEQQRINKESQREAAEQQRITAEQGRVSAESARVQAEQARVLAETLRANAEDQRAANEQNRVAAEQQRIERAEQDHQRAESDHATYVDSLGAFDISSYHATDGVLAKYVDLTAALGTGGANIPDDLRKGGMSVKFVQSSDNKYVQYRLMANQWSTTVNDWQSVESAINAVDGYFICDTVSGNSNKSVSIPGYKLQTGGSLKIKFENIASTSTVNLNISSTGLKPLYLNGVQANYQNTWAAGDVLEIYYDGEKYQAINLSNIDSISKSNLRYSVCSSASGNQNKGVSINGFVLFVGGCIKIKFDNVVGNTSNVNLVINSTISKPLYYNGSRAGINNSWDAGDVVEFYYDGENFQGHTIGLEKFKTGEVVKNTSIVNSLTDGSNDLVKGGAIKSYVDSKTEDIQSLDDSVNGISPATVEDGNLAEAGYFINVDDGEHYNHLVMHITPGSILSITGKTGIPIDYAVLKTYPEPVASQMLDFCDSIQGRQRISDGSTVTFTVPQDAHYLVTSNNYGTTNNYYRPLSVTENGKDLINGTDSLQEQVDTISNGNLSFLRYNHSQDSFEFFSRAKNRKGYFSFIVKHIINNADDVYMNLWRLCGGNYYSGTKNNLTLVCPIIMFNENEWATAFNGFGAIGGYTGGVHGGERIDVNNDSYVKFFADGKELTDLSADFEIECNSFRYIQNSTLHKVLSGGSVISGHPTFASHVKINTFEDNGFFLHNLVKFDEQVVSGSYHSGLVCIGKGCATEAIMPNGKIVDCSWGGTEVFTSSDNMKEKSIVYWDDTNNIGADVSSEFVYGLNDADVNMFGINNREVDSKYYRRIDANKTIDANSVISTTTKVQFK